MQSARGLDTRTRSQSQMYMISLGYLNDSSQSLALFAGPRQCYLTEIMRQNDPRANYLELIEAKYSEIKDLINRGPFRVVFRADVPYVSSLVTARYVFTIKSYEDKRERYNERYIASRHLDIMKD